MPDDVNTDTPRPKKTSRIQAKMLDLSSVEHQAKSRYLNMDLNVFKLACEESWEELASAARQGRGDALIALTRLKGASRMAPKTYSETADLRKVLSDPEYRKGLENFMAKSGEDISSIERYLDKADYKKTASMPKDLVNSNLHEQGSYAIATGFTGYWAGFFAEFNLECKKGNAVRLNKFEDLETMMNFISGQNEFLWALLLLFKEMFADWPPGKIHQKSMSTLLLLEEQFVWLPAYAAKIYLTLEKAKQEGKAKAVHALSRMDLDIGILARRWALVSAVALYAAYIGTLSEDDKVYKDVRKNSQKLPAKSVIPHGEKVTLQALTEKGWGLHGKLVQVTGVVSNIGVSRKGGVYRTEFTLSDLTGEHQVQALAVYLNLAHRGMLDGCNVSINGTWEMASKLVDYPMIKINRVSLSNHKKESWLDYMATVVRPWFDLYPNSHNLIWSVRPENKEGEIAKESNKTGAGEIEFNKAFLYKGGK